MLFQFGFKHMASSDALRQTAEKKILEKISKFSTKPDEVHVTFSVQKHNHHVHFSIKGGDGFSFDVEHDGVDMYACIDMAVDKLETQMRRQKEKIKDHKKPRVRDFSRHFPPQSNQYEPAEIDAEDILRYENARRRLRAG